MRFSQRWRMRRGLGRIKVNCHVTLHGGAGRHFKTPVNGYEQTQYDSLLNKVKDKNLQIEGKLKGYIADFTGVEDFFFMRAEDFAFMMATAEKPSASSEEWNRVYGMLDTAYKKKVGAMRQAKLKENPENLQELTAMLQLASGEVATAGSDPIDKLLDKLRNYIPEADFADFEKLVDQAKKATKPDGSLTPTGANWETVSRILGLAWRNREGEPVAQKVEWLNLCGRRRPYYPADGQRRRRCLSSLAYLRAKASLDR